MLTDEMGRDRLPSTHRYTSPNPTASWSAPRRTKPAGSTTRPRICSSPRRTVAPSPTTGCVWRCVAALFALFLAPLLGVTSSLVRLVVRRKNCGWRLTTHPNTYQTPQTNIGHPRPPARAGLCAQRLPDRPLPRLRTRAVRQGSQCVVRPSVWLVVCCVLAPSHCVALPIDEPISSARSSNPIKHQPKTSQVGRAA